MRTKTYLVLTAILILFCQTIFAIPAQEDFYHKIYKIEWKGSNGKVLTRYPQSPQAIQTPKGTQIVNPPFGEHVSLYFVYTGSARQQWIIAPITPGGNEFYIINKETGYPLMIDGGNIRINTSGITDDRQRFKFKNINGDYFQIESASTPGYVYKMDNPLLGGGYYYQSLSYVATTSSINDDYSYFKLTEVGDITGSSNVTAANLVYQPNLVFNIPQPPNLTSYDDMGATLYSNETVIGESWVPFSLINDDAYTILGQLAGTPFYKIIRKQAWKKVKDISWQPGADFTVTYKSYQGITQGETNTTQLTLEHSWSMNGTVEFTQAPIKLTLGRTYTEKLSRSFTQVNSYTENAWDQVDQTLIFNTGSQVRVVVYELVDRYYVKRMDGTEVVTPFEVLYREYTVHKTWPRVNMSKDPITGSITISPAPPAAPTNLQVAIGATSLLPELTWTASASSNVSQYEIWGKVGAAGTWGLIGVTPYSYFTDMDMYYDDNNSYYYKIRAKSTANLYSAFSSEVSTVPAAPTGIALSSSSGTSGPVKISWTKNTESNVTSYEVYRDYVEEPAGWQLIGTTTSNNLIDQEYYYAPNWGIMTGKYKVRAKNNLSRYSPFSSEASVRIEPNYKQNGDNPVDDEMTVPVEYNISQNYPNPFNPSTVIVYDIPEAARVTLKVYDMLGREVANLVDEYKEAGRYSAKFDASRLSTGIYIYKLTANEFQSVKKMNFVK